MTFAPEDAARQEARRACGKWLRSQRLKRRLEGDSELTCLQVAGAERMLSDASALTDRNILHLLEVSF
jgi:hypothetical protein